MSNRYYTEKHGLDRFAVDLSGSSMRIRQHQKSGAEFVIGAFMWCVSKGDHASASVLRTHRRCVDADDEQTGCELCRPDPFAGLAKPLLSISEAESEREAELEVA